MVGLALPLIISYLADVAIIPSVSAVVGRLGVAALSAIVSFEIMAKLLSEKAARTLSPAVTRIAAAQSRGDEARVRIEAGSSVALAVILGLMISIAALFIPKVMANCRSKFRNCRLDQGLRANCRLAVNSCHGYCRLTCDFFGVRRHHCFIDCAGAGAACRGRINSSDGQQ